MRESVVSIQEPLTQGLRPEPEVTGHGRFLEDCFNMKPAEGGLEKWSSPEDPLPDATDPHWPWPQFFLFDDYSLIVEETTVSMADKSSDPWGLSGITTLDPSSPTTGKGIPGGGGVWHGADLGEAWYLFKGNATVFQTGLHRIDGSPRRFVDTDVTIRTGTTHKGRIVMGGFEEGNFWTQDFQNIFNTFTQPTGVSFNFDDVGKNWIAWSSIGGGDFPFWHFEPDDIDTDLGIHLTKERFFKRLKRNELGFMPLSFEGEVFKLKRLGDGLVAYGEDGISFLSLVSGGETVASTYGEQEVGSVGITGRGAVAGDRRGHVFLSKEGYLWRLSAEMELTRLGYKQHLSPLTEQTVMCSYNPSEEEYYICSSDKGFVLTRQGLSRHKDHLTDFVYHLGEGYGTSFNPGNLEAKVITNETDMSLAARKRVNSVHVNSRNIIDLEGALRTKYDRTRLNSSKGYQRTDFVPSNKEGVIHVRATGVELRAELQFYPKEGARINSISLRYQVSDKRAIRGTFQDAG